MVLPTVVSRVVELSETVLTTGRVVVADPDSTLLVVLSPSNSVVDPTVVSCVVLPDVMVETTGSVVMGLRVSELEALLLVSVADEAPPEAPEAPEENTPRAAKLEPEAEAWAVWVLCEG